MVVLSALKEAYRDEEDTPVEVEITRKPAEKKAVEGEAAKNEAVAGDVEVEITKAHKEAWKKPTDKLYRFKITGKIPLTRPRQSVPNPGFHLVGPGLILVDLV